MCGPRFRFGLWMSICTAIVCSARPADATLQDLRNCALHGERIAIVRNLVDSIAHGEKPAPYGSWWCDSGSCNSLSGQLLPELHVPGFQTFWGVGFETFDTRFGPLKVKTDHAFLSNSEGSQEIIVDPTYLQFFVSRPPGVPDIFVGTRADLIALFEKNKDLIYARTEGRVLHGVNPEKFVDATWRFGSHSSQRQLTGGLGATEASSRLVITAEKDQFIALDRNDRTFEVLAQRQNGVLTLLVRSTLADGTPGRFEQAAQQIENALRSVKNYNSILAAGKRGYGGFVSDLNLRTGPAQKNSFEEAVFLTREGAAAKKFGFTRIHVIKLNGSPGNYSEAAVEFTKPEQNPEAVR